MSTEATSVTRHDEMHACPIVCGECGGQNVQHAMWVRVNTDEVVDSFGTWNFDGSAWCEDCETHVLLADKCD